MSTSVVDIIVRTANTINGWIPTPISKQSPLYEYEISLDEMLQLLPHGEVFIKDHETKTSITFGNLQKYFPEYNPSGGGSGGGGSDDDKQKPITVDFSMVYENIIAGEATTNWTFEKQD